MFCGKRLLLLLPLNHYQSIRISTALDSKNAQLGALPFRPLLLTVRCSSSTSSLREQNDKQSFTISYLVNSCGLSPQSAKSISKNVLLSNISNADAVLTLLRDYGLTDKHISQVVKKHPRLLLLDSDQRILPKLQFLRSIGFSSIDLSTVLVKNPQFLSRSLNQCLIPCYNVLKSLLLSDKQIVMTFKRVTSRFNLNSLSMNAASLKEVGMPPPTIARFLTRCPYVFSADTNKFSGAVNEVVEMGFDPSKFTFATAVKAKITLSKKTWKHKIDAFGKWGISADEVLAAFRKHPQCIFLSEESIDNKMNFLVTKMGWQLADILKQPVVLCYNLEERIMPRCLIFNILLSKGFIKSKIGLFAIVHSSEETFSEKYVLKHKEKVPELVDVFERKMGVEELEFRFGERHATSQVHHSRN